MNSGPKKSKFTVEAQPLKNKGLFDIPLPANHKKPSSSAKKHIVQKIKGGYFIALTVFIFILLTLLSVYNNSLSFLIENKPIAFAGYDRLSEATHSLINQDFDRADRWFKGAEDAFQEVNQSAQFLSHQANGYLQSGLYVDTAQKMLESGLTTAQLGQQFSQLLAKGRDLPDEFIRQNTGGLKSEHLMDQVKDLKSKLDQIRHNVLQLHKNMVTLNKSTLPEDLGLTITKSADYLNDFLILLNEMNNHFEAVLTMFGDDLPHRYLILFQNNHERRATGGFIGSYAIIDVNDAVITKVEVRDIYQTDGQLTKKVPAPPGIDQVADRLYMRDANYSPDFPTSAEQVSWFLDQSRGPSVDTVIAIDQNVAEKLLELIGSVQLKGFSSPLSADNFNELMSFYVEAKLSVTDTPKQWLVDLIPLLKDRLISNIKFKDLALTFLELAEGQHIQMYSYDQQVQQLAEDLAIDGKLIQSQNIDFLSVISTSIGGNKSDAFIKSDYTHQTTIESNGSILNQLTLKKEHMWSEKDFEPWKQLIRRYSAKKLNEETLRFIHGKGPNIDYMRVYVPLGSELIDAEGLSPEEIRTYEELNYTVFAFKMTVLSGQASQFKLSYRLPFKLDKKGLYKLIVQKQAGSENINLIKGLQTVGDLRVLKTHPDTQRGIFDLDYSYQTPLNHHQFFLSAIARKDY